MSDALAAILGLQQQNAQETNAFLDPNTLSKQLTAGIQGGRQQQQLDLEKARFGLAQSAQSFDQNYKTQVLDMKRKEFQSEQELNDMLFPVQGKMLKYQQAKAMSALDLQSAQIDREDALTEQTYANQDKIASSRQYADNFLSNQLNAYSDADLVDGTALKDATSIPGLTHEDLVRVTGAVKAAEAQQRVHNQKIEQANLEILHGQATIDKNKAALDKYLVPFNDLDDNQKQEITSELVSRKSLETQGRSALLRDLSNPSMKRSIKTDSKGGISYSVSPTTGTKGSDRFLGMTDNQYTKAINDVKKDSAFQGEFGGLPLKQQEIKARDVLKQRLGIQGGGDEGSSATPVDSFFNSVGIQ